MKQMCICILWVFFHSVTMGAEHALLIGATSISPGSYPGKTFASGPVRGSGEDVRKMATILMKSGFQSSNIKKLVGLIATKENILKELLRVKSILKAGDVFVFYFSGHGDTLTDLNRDELPYLFDQALVTSNKYLIDDELNRVWRSYSPGVKIYHLIDACYSGEIYKIFQKQYLSNKFQQLPPVMKDDCLGLDATEPFNMYSVSSASKDRVTNSDMKGEGILTEDIYRTYLKLDREDKLREISAAEFFETICSLTKGFIFLNIHSGTDLFKNDYIFKN